MGEKFRLYNEQGKIDNPDVAHKMANLENPVHKKRWGIFPVSKKKIEGRREFQDSIGQDEVDKLNKEQNILESINSIEFSEKSIKMEVNGHLIEIFGEISLTPVGEKFLFIETSGTIDEIELAKVNLKEIKEKFNNAISKKFLGNEEEVKRYKIIKEMEKQAQDELITKNESAVKEVLK